MFAHYIRELYEDAEHRLMLGENEIKKFYYGGLHLLCGGGKIMLSSDTRFSYMKNTLFHISCIEYPEVNYVFKSEKDALEHLREWFRIDYHNRDSLTYMIRIEVVSKETYKEIETDDC